MTRPMRILTWNTWLQSDPTSKPDPNPQTRAPLIAAKLRASDRDILLLQKVWKSRDTLIDGLRPAFPHISGTINDKAGLNLHSGLLTASRSKLRLLGSIDFEETQGVEGMFSNKGAALWQGSWDGFDFQIASLHLQGHVSGHHAESKLPETRRAQLRQCRDELLEKWSRPRIPQIICGDFSIPFGSGDYADVLRILDAEGGPITGAVPHTAYGREKGAYPNDIGREFIDQPQTLDHILLRRNGGHPTAVAITRTVRRYTEAWKARGGSTYRNLAYRYTLEGAVAFKPAGEETETDIPEEETNEFPLRIAADHVL